MDPSTPEDARDFARQALAGLTDKAGDPLVAHAERMADTFHDPIAKQVAYLHDVIEDSDVTAEALAERFPAAVVDAVVVLTRRPGEIYKDYIRRVALTGGLPRSVKQADVRDHLKHARHITPSLARRYRRARGLLRVAEMTEKERAAQEPAPGGLT